MKRWIHASTKKSIRSSSDTRDRINYLQDKIEILKEYLARNEYEDPEERIDDQMELAELEEQLNFAWQDDEAEYNYALQQQEFNPDGSLKGYGDYYDDTCSCTKVTASSEWAASWDKRSFVDGDSAPYYVMSVPSGTARVLPNDVEGSKYHAEIKFRNGSNLRSVALDSYLDAMDWAEDMLFNKNNVKSSSKVCGSTTTLEKAKSDCQWMKGLYWDIDGHDMTITGVNGYPLFSCEVTESWIAEDTGKQRKSKAWYAIKEDDKGYIYLQNKKYPEYKLYLQSALNYTEDKIPEEFDELDFIRDRNNSQDDSDYDYEEDDYTPSATRGDYSPSNPWDAPGMSIHDFI